ncbi:KH domain-containing protein [Candidatus Woesebacteria bacterium]|nr:KH domain-containing protein [Candidatus Woesebacteria bacterium]
MKKDLIKEVQKDASRLLVLMGTKAKAKVTQDKENDIFLVNIKTEQEAGLLIGHHGETLTSIQAVLGLMFRQRTGEWKRMLVNVGDWREKQEEYLKEMAGVTAERAKQTGEPQNLYNLSAAQRRVIHMALSEDGEVETESVGEGDERYLVIKPKK